MNMLRGEGVNVILYMCLCWYMKFVVDNYAIDKTQVDYILNSDNEYLYLNNALEYTWIKIKSIINRYLRAHMHDTTYINNETEKLTHNI